MGAEIRAYYRSALALLKHVEARQPTNRRFGAEADALWSQFKGELTTADRLDTLLRDADAQWPGAFGGRTVFDLNGVSEDEPFGAKWEGLDGVLAQQLWLSSVDSAVSTARAALVEVSESWDLTLHEVHVGTIGAADRIIVVGPSAIVALILAFVGAEELDWSQQVVVVATPPAHRQLGAAAGGILGLTHGLRLASSTSTDLKALRGGLRGKIARLIISDDASPRDVALARELTIT